MTVEVCDKCDVRSKKLVLCSVLIMRLRSTPKDKANKVYTFEVCQKCSKEFEKSIRLYKLKYKDKPKPKSKRKRKEQSNG